MARWATVATIVVGVVLVGWLGLLLGAWLANPPVLGLQEDGALADCPGGGNCVSSRATDEAAAVDPYTCPDASLPEVVEVADAALARTTIEVVEGSYAHLTARTRFVRFVDDLELQAVDGVIHVRSASRLGRRDFGANRDRVETLRSALLAAGLCR